MFACSRFVSTSVSVFLCVDRSRVAECENLLFQKRKQGNLYWASKHWFPCVSPGELHHRVVVESLHMLTPRDSKIAAGLKMYCGTCYGCASVLSGKLSLLPLGQIIPLQSLLSFST